MIFSSRTKKYIETPKKQNRGNLKARKDKAGKRKKRKWPPQERPVKDHVMSPDLRVAFQERKIRSNLDIISFQGNSSENNECFFSFVFFLFLYEKRLAIKTKNVQALQRETLIHPMEEYICVVCSKKGVNKK